MVAGRLKRPVVGFLRSVVAPSLALSAALVSLGVGKRGNGHHRRHRHSSERSARGRAFPKSTEACTLHDQIDAHARAEPLLPQ